MTNYRASLSAHIALHKISPDRAAAKVPSGLSNFVMESVVFQIILPTYIKSLTYPI